MNRKARPRGSLSHPARRSQILLFVLGLALVALIAISDYFTGFEFDLSVLYLVPVCLIAWAVGRLSGIALAVVAVAAWYANDRVTGHIFPHAFLIHPDSVFHIWKALVLFATWAAFAIVIDKLKVALAHSDERFATVLEGLDEAVYVADPKNGELLYLNSRCRNGFATGTPLTRAEEIERQLQPAQSRRPASRDEQSGEYFDAARDRWYMLSTRQLRWIDGRDVRLKAATEITEHKHLEELHREQQEKLQITSHLVTVGQMASTLAHEINQPLAAIANYSMGCVRRLRAGKWDAHELLAALEKTSAQAERAGRIVQRVRELVRKHEPQAAACDVNKLISNAASVIKLNADKNNVRLELELAADLPAVFGDGVMLEQVLLNLARNAIESMENTPADERKLMIRSTVDKEGAIAIEVIDTGCGMPENLIRNPFAPFVTTKPDGLGMGLSICRSIMEWHKGRLWATPNSGRGTTFHVMLRTAQA